MIFIGLGSDDGGYGLGLPQNRKTSNPKYGKQPFRNGDTGKMKLNKNDEKVVAALREAKELTLAELTENTGIPGKKVFKSLKKLFEHEIIDTQARKYRLLAEKIPASKGAEENDVPEDE